MEFWTKTFTDVADVDIDMFMCVYVKLRYRQNICHIIVRSHSEHTPCIYCNIMGFA
jgi:hypothetical protein